VCTFVYIYILCVCLAQVLNAESLTQQMRSRGVAPDTLFVCIYINTHTRTHTYIHIYVCVCVCVCVCVHVSTLPFMAQVLNAKSLAQQMRSRGVAPDTYTLNALLRASASYLYTYMYMYMQIDIDIYMYTYTYIYTLRIHGTGA